jgi:hypothetical protein
MSRKETPDPDPSGTAFKVGCGVALLLVSLAFTITAVLTGWWWLLLACLPGILVFGLVGLDKLLLLSALYVYRLRGIAGILVTSDSPHWNVYIRERWIDRFGERFVVLNWSQRREWKLSLAEILYRRYCGQHRNFCPAIVYLRGLRYPLVFQFFYAFRDHKHGNDRALRRLEARLFEELGVDRGDFE